VKATPKPIERLVIRSIFLVDFLLFRADQPAMKVGHTWNCSFSATTKAR
jgi:hypothetical protein